MGRYVTSDPNIKENWHFVEMPNKAKTHEERVVTDLMRKEWCDENAHGRWTRDYRRELDQYGRSSWTYGYFFRGPNDAMLFKLTFAGGM